MEGKFCDYIVHQYKKKVLLTGPMLPEPDKSKPREDQWSHWLSCGVLCIRKSNHCREKPFQELCLGIELSGLPFLVAVRPPKGAKTIQEALPEGFEEWFSKENLSGVVRSLMENDSEIGNQVRRNHSELKEILASPGLLTGYTDKFVDTLENLVNDTNRD